MGNRIMLVLVAFSFFLMASPAGIAAQGGFTLEQVLASMEEAGKAFRSMQANIERTKVTVIVDDKFVDYGSVYFNRRGTAPRIKIEIQRPEQQRTLIDQGKALLYFPKLNQVQEYTLGANQDKAELLLIGFGQSNEHIEEAYDVSLVGEETISGQKTSVIDMKPKSAKASALFTSVRLWLDQKRWVPLQSRMTEASGDYMIVKFTNIRMNMRLPDSTFDLKLPKDVQVVKM